MIYIVHTGNAFLEPRTVFIDTDERPNVVLAVCSLVWGDPRELDGPCILGQTKSIEWRGRNQTKRLADVVDYFSITDALDPDADQYKRDAFLAIPARLVDDVLDREYRNALPGSGKRDDIDRTRENVRAVRPVAA